MRNSVFIALAGLAALCSVPGRAAADSVIISDIVSKTRLGNACTNVGGAPTTGIGGGGYGCKKENCDGKGGTCTVKCTKEGVCEGTTPGRVAGGGKLKGTVGQVLGNSVAEKTPTGAADVTIKRQGPVKSGILEQGPAFGTTGPAATGSPARAPSSGSPTGGALR